MAIDQEFDKRVAGHTQMAQTLSALHSVLADARQSAGISQRILAKRCGVQRTYISKLENGHTDPTIRSLFRIAEGLRIPASKLIERAELQMSGVLARRREIGRQLGTLPTDSSVHNLGRV